ncbi:MAG: FHA domain-containing protein, partial [Pseudomonadota bacterium]
ISREHVAVVRRWEGVVVQDLGSKNGITINEQTGTRADGELRVRDGDLVRIGPATLRLSDPADRYLREIEAQAADEAPRQLAPGPAPVAAARPPAKRPPSQALRAVIAVATGVLVMVVLAVVMLAVGASR